MVLWCFNLSRVDCKSQKTLNILFNYIVLIYPEWIVNALNYFIDVAFIIVLIYPEWIVNQSKDARYLKKFRF